jgi:hypothetical protein
MAERRLSSRSARDRERLSVNARVGVAGPAIVAWVVAIAWVGVACNGQFRFDENNAIDGGDAGNGADASASTGSYTSCQVDTDCKLATLHCDVGSGQCVECVQPSDCTMISSTRVACDTALHRCVQCGSTTDCPQTPLPQTCDGTTHTCVVSCSDAMKTCPNGSLCNDDKMKCVECLSNMDCIAMGGPKHECDVSSGRCSECDQDFECKAPRPHCDRIQDVCVQCKQNADCSGATPLCDPASYTCVGVP